MGEGQQGEKNVEVGRRSMGISAEQATGPREGNQHPDEPIERDQPGGLDGKRKLRGQNGEGVGGRFGRWWDGEYRRLSGANGIFVHGCGGAFKGSAGERDTAAIQCRFYLLVAANHDVSGNEADANAIPGISHATNGGIH